MSMVFPGITHCRECNSPLKYNEVGLCKECEEKMMKEYEEIKQKGVEKGTMENKEITISMEEYKELLIIKGKYEELKSQQTIIKPNYILTRDLMKKHKITEPPYKITCKEEKNV